LAKFCWSNQEENASTSGRGSFPKGLIHIETEGSTTPDNTWSQSQTWDKGRIRPSAPLPNTNWISRLISASLVPVISTALVQYLAGIPSTSCGGLIWLSKALTHWVCTVSSAV